MNDNIDYQGYQPVITLGKAPANDNSIREASQAYLESILAGLCKIREELSKGCAI